MTGRVGLIGVISGFIFILSVAFISAEFKQATAIVSPGCSEYEIIYARGSGQEAKYSNEFTAFKSNLISQGVKATAIYELDVSTPIFQNQHNLSYPAVEVLNPSGVTAVLSRGNFGKYVESARSGKELLVNHIINSNLLSCGTKLVLAGYSQGGQVISDTLVDSRISNYLPQISFVATFGDPSLDLNTVIGGNIFSQTPWYRGNAAKYISGGLVKVRNPYVPKLLETKTGAWCLADDMICTGNLFQALNEFVSKPHTTQYPKKAIPDAAREIAQRLREDLKQPFTGPTCGALKQDIVIALNTSPSIINDSTFFSENGLNKFFSGITGAACDVRVGLVTFGRKDKEVTQPVFDLTSDYTKLNTSLNSLKALPKSMTIEKVNVVDAIDKALDFTWRDDAQKMVLVMSDAPGNNYKENFGNIDQEELINQSVMQNLLRKSREKGGVEIHASNIIHNTRHTYTYTAGTTSFYAYMSRLVGLTAGTYRDRERCDTCTWMDTRFDFKDILARKPTVSVPNIRLKKGESMTLNAKDVSGGVIPEALKTSYGISYSWTTDCTQLHTQIYSGPTVTFKPIKVGSCTGAILVRAQGKAFCNTCYEGDPYGVRAVIPFSLEVLPADYTPPPVPGLVRHITKERLWDDNTLRITWDAPENAGIVGELAYVVKDEDGTVLGITRTPTIDITDVADTDDPIILVSAASNDGMGVATSSKSATDTTKPKIVATTPPTPTSPTPVETVAEVLGTETTLTKEVATTVSQVPAVVAHVVEVSGKPVSLFDQTISTISSAGVGVENLIKQGEVHTTQAWQQGTWWTKLTIVAIPIAAAVTMGLAIKYGLRLAAKR